MFSFIVTQALKNRILVLVAAGFLVVFGALTARRLPVDVFPDLNRPTVTIMTEAEGLAPQEVEQRVTYPIETQMNGLPGVTRVRSVSGVGLSIVYVEFAWGTEIFRNRQQVAERLTLVQRQLPPNTTPQMGPINSIMGQILLVALTAPEGVSPMSVREIADFVVRPRLLTIPGVAQVIPMGGEVRQYRVAPNPAALRAFGLTYEQLEKALSQFGGNTGGGFTEQYAQEFLIRNIGRTLSLEDLGNLVVAKAGNRPIHLRQVAEVSFAARTKRGDAGYMGAPAVIVSIEKQPDVDTVRLTQEIEKALAELTPTLPHGIKADNILFRQANFIADLDRQRHQGPVRGGGSRRGRAVRLPAQLAHHGHLADRHSGVDPVDRHHLPPDGAVHQHDDARRARDRHRRAGRRRRRRRREHLPAPAREPRAGQSAIGLRCRGVGVQRGALGHRLRHAHHRAGVRAALCALRHRGAPVRARSARPTSSPSWRASWSPSR